MTLFYCFEENRYALTITSRSLKCSPTLRVRTVCWQLSCCRRVKEEGESEWTKLRFTFIEGGSLCEIYAYIHTYTKEMYMSPSVSTFHKEIYSWYDCFIEEKQPQGGPWRCQTARLGQWARPQQAVNEADVPSLQNMFIAQLHIAYSHGLYYTNFAGGGRHFGPPTCVYLYITVKENII